jgi:hypothetical protein
MTSPVSATHVTKKIISCQGPNGAAPRTMDHRTPRVFETTARLGWEVSSVTVALLIIAGAATVTAVACETLMERRRRPWVGWLEAAVVLYVAVDILAFRLTAAPWLLWLITVIMVAVATWRLNQLRRERRTLNQRGGPGGRSPAGRGVGAAPPK